MTVKIVHLITSLQGGGTENFLHQILSTSPSRYEHQVFFLGRDGVNGDRIRRLGVRVHRVRSPLNLYRILRVEHPDVLHTCLFWAHQMGRIVGRFARVPLIVSSHQSIDIWQKPWHGWLDRLTLPLCDCVDVNSLAAQRLIEERSKGMTHPPRIVKVENSVDFEHFKRQDRSQVRTRYQLPSDALVGGTLMRLHPEKGAEHIPKFADTLLKEYPRLTLLIGGTGPLEARLKKQTAAFGDRIRWIGWQDDTPAFLSAIDFFWLLSREESFPQALLEASAMGLPWMATDVGGVRELLEAGTCGLFMTPFDTEQMLATTRTLITELDSRTSQARRAVSTLQSRFSPATMSNAFYGMMDQ